MFKSIVPGKTEQIEKLARLIEETRSLLDPVIISFETARGRVKVEQAAPQPPLGVGATTYLKACLVIANGSIDGAMQIIEHYNRPIAHGVKSFEPIKVTLLDKPIKTNSQRLMDWYSPQRIRQELTWLEKLGWLDARLTVSTVIYNYLFYVGQRLKDYPESFSNQSLIAELAKVREMRMHKYVVEALENLPGLAEQQNTLDKAPWEV